MKDNRKDFIKKTVPLTALSFGGIDSVKTNDSFNF